MPSIFSPPDGVSVTTALIGSFQVRMHLADPHRLRNYSGYAVCLPAMSYDAEFRSRYATPSSILK